MLVFKFQECEIRILQGRFTIDDLLYFRMQNLVVDTRASDSKGDYSVSSRPCGCVGTCCWSLGTKAGRPRPFPTTTQLGVGLYQHLGTKG